jgi:hypothetical protein
MMGRRALLAASAIALVAIVAVVVALAGDGFEVVISSLPEGMNHPDCREGQEVGTHHIDYAEGSGFATPTEALASALASENAGSSALDFWGRAVQRQGGLAYDFILRRRNGSLEEMASARHVEGEGWLVSVTYRCFTPNPDEVADANG